MVLLSWLAFRGPRIDRSRVYRIGYGNDSPLHFKDENGEPAGMAVEIVKEAARRIGIRLSWEYALDRPPNRKPFDLTVLQTIRSERSSIVHFTQPYIATKPCFVVLAGSAVRTVGDLKAARIAFTDYRVHRDNLARILPKAQLLPRATSREAIATMVSGLADAVYIDQYSVLTALRNGGFPRPVNIVEAGIPRSQLAMASTPDCAAVADAIREEMRAMDEDGSGAAISERWAVFPVLSDDVIRELATSERTNRRLVAGVAALTAFLLLTTGLAIRYRRENMRRVRTEAALLENEQRYRSLFEAENDAILVLDKEAETIVEANRAAAEMYGYARSEIVGLHRSELWALPSQGDPPAAIAENTVRIRLHKTKDGSEFPVEIRVGSFESQGRKYQVAAIRDISERVEAERSLKAVQNQLLQAQKMEAIGQLAGGVAHDFNNILGSVLLNVSLLEGNAGLDLETRNTLSDLGKDVRRGAGLTQQLLTFGRRQSMESRPLDLKELLLGTMSMMKRLLGPRIEVSIETPENLPPVDGDQGMLEQVLVNLCVNSRDAMPHGGRLTLKVAPFSPDKAALAQHPDARPGNFLRLSVTDNGEGMDENTLKHLFEPFFTTKGVGKGTGLGLSTVYGIVKQHKGWIEVTSKPGEGSAFHVFLPASETSIAGGSDPDFAQPPPDGSETILVVEDEDKLRQAVSKILDRSGYRVIAAANGAEALRIWESRANEVDLVFTDIAMPGGLSGLDLAAALLNRRPGLKVIAYTGYLQEEDQARLTEMGIPLIRKPFEVPILLQRLRQVLDSRGSTRRGSPGSAG